MESQADLIRSQFVELFGKEPLLVRSPGRINLIGEHTDYNDGFVMPAAIDKEIVFAIANADDKKSTIHSINYGEHITVVIDSIRPVDNPKWANYLLGVLHRIVEAGMPAQPFYCVFGGDIPTGAGLSSSAALECGFAFAINELFQLNIPRMDIIQMAQWSEHHYVGVMCGIMDQFASVMGKAGHAIFLDCETLEHRYVPLDLRDHVLILCDSKVKHSLVDSAYNTRREECAHGLAILRRQHPQLESLRGASMEMLEKQRDEFPAVVYNRCAYVIAEIERVRLASQDLDNGNLAAFGKKMFDTHDGLSRLYEVSCAELDFLVDEARKFDGVLGARMMGGGFGGCTINIVKQSVAENFIRHMERRYRETFSINASCYPASLCDGTSTLRVKPHQIKT